MFYYLDSHSLLQPFLETSGLVRLLNTYGVTLFQSYFYVMLAFFIYSIVLSRLYTKKIKVVRYALSSVLLGVLTMGVVFGLSTLRVKWDCPFHFEDLFVIYPPYFIVFHYLVCAYILKIDKSLSLNTSVKIYIVTSINVVQYYWVEALYFRMLSSDLTYIMFIMLLANTTMAVFNIAMVAVLSRLIQKKKLWRDAYSLKQTTPNVSGRLMKYTADAVILYVLNAAGIQMAKRTNDIVLIQVIFISIILINLLQLYISYMRDVRKADRINIANQALHIRSLMESVDGFRTIKHDMNNMMQVYGGYIQANDWKSLRKHHATLFQETRLAGDLLTLNIGFERNPALYTLLNTKIADAHDKNVYVSATINADAGEIAMEPLDLTRIVGILLDNAIEETMHTSSKTVTFSLQKIRSGKMLLSISNPTVNDVNVKRILDKGYSSKENHSGLGLHTLWNLVNRTPGCRLNIAYLDRAITFYLELPIRKGNENEGEGQ